MVRKNSESKPRGLYFSKALLRGLFLEGLIREICVSKSARLILGGKYWGLRLSHASSLSISKPKLKSEIRKQQYTMSLFDCNHLVHVIVLWQMQKFMCYFTVFALFILNSRATSKYKPRGLVFGGTIYRRQEPYVTSLGGSYLLGLSLGILRYLNN